MKDLLLEIKNILKGILKKEVDVTIENVNKELSLAYRELVTITATDVLREHAVRLSELWIDILNNNDQRAILEAVNISGTYNSLSKMNILGNKWIRARQNSFKSLIVKLAKEGQDIYEEFNSQHIANILNALSKWDVFNNSLWTKDKQKEFKNLIVELIDQGDKTTDKFNSQEIANILNALSKWNVLDTEIQPGSKEKVKSFIIKLIERGNKIDSTQFNSQHIANILNALSKWDVLDSDVWDGKITIDGKPDGDVKQFKTLIVKLVDQGIQSSTQFNSQQLSTNHTIYTRQYVALTLSTLSIFINDMLDLFTNICNNQIISLTI